MGKYIDITNKKFGKLTAIKFSRRAGKDYYWLFRCDCGKEKEIRKNSVISGKIVSCGCYHKKITSFINRTHHLRKTELYIVWTCMKQRCYNKNHKRYKDWGGRGIKICDKWRYDFKSFYDWAMSSGWQKGLTIDRINNDDDYCPENCRWATREQQVRNRRNNIWITYEGETKLLKDWLTFFKISNSSYYSKKKLGVSDDEIFKNATI